MIAESNIYKIIRYVVLIAAAAFVIIPIIPLVFMAFKTGVEFSSTSVFTPPRNWLNGYNFSYAIRVGDLFSSLATTIIVLAVSITIGVNFACMVAFAVQRFDFKAKKIIMLLFLMTMFIPVVTTQVVVFQIIYRIHLVNTIGALILLYSGTGIVDIYIVSNLLNTIPKELDEAGLLDGANYFRIYFSVILPLLKPAIITMAVIKGIGIYNDFYLPNLYLIRGTKTLTLALYRFFAGLSTPFEVVSAAVLMAVIPVVILFLFAQKYIYNGLAGAVKS
ncbi:MAG: carbohydrate ABC transporter permease [Spirochaetaceae bacterium]|jgi:multiple sugar transport system permease protein|nr:carbohydrate ABC transporter permease [Spirochaetaceae bacterium]